MLISKGCAACHGQRSEGTALAPALAGHSVDQTKRQVRAPVGLMPVFPPDKVSNEELAEIAEYVASLGGGHHHAQSVNPGDAVAQHHWMALFALEEEDQPEATHHLNHLMELVSGSHAARMQEALNETAAGRYHDGAHIVEEMLAGIDPLELTQRDMHLRLAISAARVEDTPEAIHQMEHYIDLVEAGSTQATKDRGILELLNAGEIADADHEMSELAGIEAEHLDEEHVGDGGHMGEEPGHPEGGGH